MKWLNKLNKTFGTGTMMVAFLLLVGYGSVKVNEHIYDIDSHFIGYLLIILFISVVYAGNFARKNRMEMRLPVRIRLLIDSGLPELCGIFVMGLFANYPVGCFIIIVNSMLKYGIQAPKEKYNPLKKEKPSSAVNRWVHLPSLDVALERNTSYICDGFTIVRCFSYNLTDGYCSELSPKEKTRPLRFVRHCDGDNLDDVQQAVKWLFEFSPFLFGIESECRDYYRLLHMKDKTGMDVFTPIHATYMMFSIDPVWYDNRTRFSYKAYGSFCYPVDDFTVDFETVSVEYPYVIVIDGKPCEKIARESLAAIHYLVDKLNKDVVNKYKNIRPDVSLRTRYV